MHGDGRIFQRGAWFWCAYMQGGKERRERCRDKTGANTSDRAVAEKFLRGRIKELHAAELGGPQFVTTQMRKLTVADLLAGLKDKYATHGQLSAQNVSHLKRAVSDLGHLSATAATSKDFAAYRERRLADGAKPASINRVLQMTRAAYGLAVKRAELQRSPYIELCSESGNARSGFFSEEETKALLAALPADGLADFVAWCSETGMRRSEAEALTWQMLDRDALHVPGNVCKNRKPRTIPLGADLSAIIERRRAARRVLALDGTASVAERIFHRGDGQPIGDFKKSWQSACCAAGLGVMVCRACQTEGPEKICPACGRARKYRGRILHDFRRSAARRLLAAGVPTQIAKQMTGHVSDSMFSRYAIIDSALLLAAQKQVAEFRKKSVGK
jgi:integrase